MAHHIPVAPQPSSAFSPRSIWFWLLATLVPIVLFFAVLGVVSSLEHWRIHVWWVPWEATEEVERFGGAKWLPQERRADMQRRVEVIDRAIPAIEGEMKFLDGELKKEQGRARTDPGYAASLRRQSEFLVQRIEELRSDRAYYLHELQEKSQ